MLVAKLLFSRNVPRKAKPRREGRKNLLSMREPCADHENARAEKAEKLAADEKARAADAEKPLLTRNLGADNAEKREQALLWPVTCVRCCRLARPCPKTWREEVPT